MSYTSCCIVVLLLRIRVLQLDNQVENEWETSSCSPRTHDVNQDLLPDKTIQTIVSLKSIVVDKTSLSKTHCIDLKL